MSDKFWNIRRTQERDELMERLRLKLLQSGRPVETIHGVPTTAGIVEESLKELERTLDRQAKKG